jgi:hypothetical protein
MRMTSRGMLIAAASTALTLVAGIPASAAPAAGAGTPGWRQVKSFGQCGDGWVRSVAVTGPSSAWASGAYLPSPCDFGVPLLAHWNGRSWRAVPFPSRFNTGQAGIGANAVAALSGSYAWTFAGLGRASYAMLRANNRWRTFSLAHNSQLTSAAVFSRTNAWAFGSVGAAAYAARFNGKTWRRVPIPVVPQATAEPRPDNLWAVGAPDSAGSKKFPRTFALAHWTGRWTTHPFPNLHLPSGQSLSGGSVVSDDSGGAWVTVNVESDNSEDSVAGVLLHWTGSRWKEIALPVKVDQLGPLAHDGHGGLWITSYPTSLQCVDQCQDLEMLHRAAAGTWTGTVVNIQNVGADSMRLIPGTTGSIWAGGLVDPDGLGDTIPVMLKYGP